MKILIIEDDTAIREGLADAMQSEGFDTLTAANGTGSSSAGHSLVVRYSPGNSEVMVPGGEFAMGDHYGFVDPAHPSDELPVHTVKVDSMYVATTTTTNAQFLTFLDAALAAAQITVDTLPKPGWPPPR